jgi:hypothetical protein
MPRRLTASFALRRPLRRVMISPQEREIRINELRD